MEVRALYYFNRRKVQWHHYQDIQLLYAGLVFGNMLWRFAFEIRLGDMENIVFCETATMFEEGLQEGWRNISKNLPFNFDLTNSI